MPAILIDFDERREVYDAPNKPGPWQKIVNVAVGEASTVDVFFKSVTQEVHVKTFKFKTQNDRRVAVTVNVNATNTITAKLVTLDDFGKNGKKDGMIVVLDSDGMVNAHSRTGELPLCPMISLEGCTSEQYDEAAATAALTVPPSQAASVFVVPYRACYNYAIRKRMVQALETAGYSNVHVIEQQSALLSSALKVAKPNKQVGEYVGIFEVWRIHVVQKTDRGYDYIQCVNDFERLSQLFPTIKDVIHFLPGTDDDDKWNAFDHEQHPLPVKFVTVGGMYYVNYMWNQHDGGNLDGYLITMPVGCMFRINYNDNRTVIDARAEMLPWQMAIERNIGDAMELDVFMEHIGACHGKVLVKQFKFTSKKNRNVLISIDIDDARLPEVKLTVL